MAARPTKKGRCLMCGAEDVWLDPGQPVRTTGRWPRRRTTGVCNAQKACFRRWSEGVKT